MCGKPCIKKNLGKQILGPKNFLVPNYIFEKGFYLFLYCIAFEFRILSESFSRV